MSPLNHHCEDIAQKQKTLKRANQALKETFVGLDDAIDEVTDAISAWYFFPELQERPLIINLWGLTGVGKTSLVKRLSSLLGFDKQFYHFDLGENGNSEYAVQQQLERIYENENGYPAIIALDEFQHARTIDEAGCEIREHKHRVIWQLLDTGRFQITRYSFGISEIYDLIRKLQHFLENGVRVANGRVCENKAYFSARRSIKRVDTSARAEKSEEDDLFVNPDHYDTIYDIARELFDSPFDVRERLLALDGQGTLKLLLRVIRCANSPKEVDCSKGLVFVLGNLDEAYSMSRDFNPDISADEFHEQSLKINVPEIKQALKKRFRHEQIGRLGNQHIIYPAHSERTFQQIIKGELDKIAQKVEASFQTALHFDDAMQALLYREGVYPTQGTRPLLTTIYQMVQSRMGNVLAEMMTRQLTGCDIHFGAHSKGVLVEFRKDGDIRHKMLFEQTFALEKLRRNKRDDVQAITAVHESGHAILAALLLRTVPEVVCSTTSQVGSVGFAFVKHRWKYISRKEITGRLAMLLGGMAAEKVVFGEEHVTTSASTDIARATELITEMLKECGMGSQIGNFNEPTPSSLSFVYDDDHRLNREAKAWLQKAFSLAEDTLRQQETLLLCMADVLSDQRLLEREAIMGLLEQHAVDFSIAEIIEDGDHLFYRKHLKEKVSQLSGKSNQRAALVGEGLVLNRKDE